MAWSQEISQLVTEVDQLTATVNTKKQVLENAANTAVVAANDATVAASASATSAGQAAGSAAQALAIYSSVEAQQTAVATAQAQASLAAGFAASAASVVQQDLSGVTAQALHRSPNAVTAMFIYDTSKDSDGGAWTEKCQHTSWWNEAINGKWLGAADSEFQARYSGSTVGAELISNGGFDTDTVWGKSVFGSAPAPTIANGVGILPRVNSSNFAHLGQSITGPAGVYRVTVTASVTVRVRAGTGSLNGSYFDANFTGTQTLYFVATAANPVIAIFSNVDGVTATVDNVSVRQVTALTTASGDYYQLTTDGRFYRLWKNLVRNGGDLTQSSWVKAALTASVSAIAPPSGVVSGVTSLVADATNAVHKVTATVPYLSIDGSASFYVRANGGRYFGVRTNSTSPARYAFFDLQNPGTVTRAANSTTDFSTATLTDVGGGWFRVTVSQAFLGGTSTNNLVIYLLGSQPAAAGGFNEATLAYTGDGTSGIFVAGVQAEFSLIPTAYEAKAADGSQTETFRGNKADFPRLAAIVAEGANVTIYDLTEAGRPMWMRIRAGGAVSESYPFFWKGSSSTTSVAAINALLAIGTNDTSSDSQAGLMTINFASEVMLKREDAASETGRLNLVIADLSKLTNYPRISIEAIGTISSDDVNAVAMTVLPDAPVDPVTGLRVPTIAVATGGGVSVIQDEGVVRNSSSTSSFDTIALTPSLLSAGRADGIWYTAANPGALGASFALAQRTAAQAPGFGVGNTGKLVDMGRSRLLRRSSVAARAQMARAHESDPARSLIATVGNDRNTGWMTGDIRRCFLSDTEVGSVTGPELRTAAATVNGGWTESGGIVTALGTAGSTDNVTFALSSPTVAGRFYEVLVPNNMPGGSFYVDFGSGTGSQVGALGSSTQRIILTCTAPGSVIRVGRWTGSPTGTIGPISVREVVADRSYRAAGASIAGTLTRAQLASGTSLVNYSGFSAANYLREPYSADLDFGTGEWTASAWVNVPATLPDGNFPVIGGDLVTNGQFGEAVTGWSAQHGATLSIVSGALRVTDDGADGAVARATQVINTVAGRTYLLTGTVPAASGGSGVIALSPTTSFNGQPNRTLTPGQTGSVVFVATSSTTNVILAVNGIGAGTTADLDNISVREVGPAIIFDRAHSTGPRLRLGVTGTGQLTAEAFDGATTRTVTTSATYNTATWLKARVNYTTDGTLAILVNGREIATTRGTPLLTLNNSNAVLTIGNSFSTDAPFPGSIALLKLGATVPTQEQATFMYEQEKQLFRAGALSVLPDSGAIVDMSYDDATDRWVAVSASNESYWTGLVRNSVTPVPAGSYTRIATTSGVELISRSTINPGVYITIPPYGLREELVKRAEAAARLSRLIATYDYVGGFIGNITTGSTAIASVTNLTYPTSYIGARISGVGIPVNAFITGVSGTTIYISAPASATTTGVSISFLDFILPVGQEAKVVMSAGTTRREGSTADYTRLYDGFKETIRFGSAPGATTWVQIQSAGVSQ